LLVPFPGYILPREAVVEADEVIEAAIADIYKIKNE